MELERDEALEYVVGDVISQDELNNKRYDKKFRPSNPSANPDDQH